VRLTPLVTVTLAVCSLAACASSGSGAAPPPPAVVTPSTQTPAQSAPPPVPAPNTPATAEGAIAFIKAYYAEMNHALYTNELSLLSAYSQPSCPCRKLVGQITDHRLKNQHWTSHAREIDSFSVDLIDSVHAEVSVHSHWPATRLVDNRGKVIDSDPGHSAVEKFVLDFSSSNWHISIVYGTYKAAA
jgi:hypothetical protein